MAGQSFVATIWLGRGEGCMARGSRGEARTSPTQPLRERTGDIPILARRLITEQAGTHGLALQRLKQHSWPGNVRELQHALLRAALLDQGELLTSAEVSRAAEQHELRPRGVAVVRRQGPGDRARYAQFLSILQEGLLSRGKIRQELGVPGDALLLAPSRRPVNVVDRCPSLASPKSHSTLHGWLGPKPLCHTRDATPVHSDAEERGGDACHRTCITIFSGSASMFGGSYCAKVSGTARRTPQASGYWRSVTKPTRLSACSNGWRRVGGIRYW
jgi:hypothetical protein